MSEANSVTKTELIAIEKFIVRPVFWLDWATCD
ncbi:hypothetical protein SSU98_1398 [Streptococcus suis 98HAH33]|nr:hypothetical protein SSU98_1398 [Streptococcus suis 98HAH33]